MGGYDLDEYEDYEDEYEEDGVGEYEEEEEEHHFPTQEESKYLELRQKLKESFRKKMKKDSGSGLSNSLHKKSKMPYDDFGSFFGPSQPVIAQRVIQESKSLLENPHLAERVSKSKNVVSQQNKGSSSIPSTSKQRPNGPPRKVDTWAKPKAKSELLKTTRDYSFLLSDDAELPIPPKNPPKPVSTPKFEAHLSPRLQLNGARKVINGREERRPSGQHQSQSQTRPKPSGQQSQRPSGSSKMTSSSLDSRKQLGSGPGRPSGHQSQSQSQSLRSNGSSKVPPVAAKQKMIPPPVSRSIPTGHNHKPPPSRTLPAVTHKKPLEHKRDERGSQFQQNRRDHENRRDDIRRDERGLQSSRGNVVRKPILSSKPQMKQQETRKISSSGQQRERERERERVQKRPSRPFDDDDDGDGAKALSMIRNMFGYNPNKYRDDDNDSDMEAGFDDIMREEDRSAWIAAKEDEEELKKIKEEERRERLRKKRKLQR